VPVIDIARDSWTAGGAANVALNLASLGARCTVVGHFGADESGRRLEGLLRERGIESLSTPGEAPTIVKTRVLVRQQQLCRLDREAAPAAYEVPVPRLSALIAPALAACHAVILSDYAKGIVNNAVIQELARCAQAAGKLVALDPKPRRGLAFHGLDLITPNKREALQLAGLEPGPHAPFPAAEVCARLHERHATRHLVVTLGEEGMLLSTGGKVRKIIPTAAREVFDVSGAGDTALAGLVLALAAGSSLEQAAHFANAAAGVVVGKLGTATVTPAELTAYVGRR
ncbi:MAG: bifunctional heptose 7-phosphate kinase/heptose 1-phosphate adenyltransferase, partial [Opitutaceae bacterium]